MSTKRTGAVVAAAGMSSRMHAFKPLLPLGDTTIIRTVIARFRAAGVSTVAVVTGHNAALLKEHVSDLAVDCLCNQRYATTDMLESARIGLSHLKDTVDRLFFTPGDVPLFAVESLHAMMQSMDESGVPLVIPSYNGRRGHPVLIGGGLMEQVLGYTGGNGLKGAFAASGCPATILDLNDRGVTLDADSRDDYRMVLHYERERRSSDAGFLQA